jgi:peptidoglycan/LPS O-acetylase OafA/YrhL
MGCSPAPPPSGCALQVTDIARPSFELASLEMYEAARQVDVIADDNRDVSDRLRCSPVLQFNNFSSRIGYGRVVDVRSSCKISAGRSQLGGNIAVLRADIPKLLARREPALDGLRALAISSVVTFHAFPDQIRGGWVGVELFFVLSGFLITSLLIAEKIENGRIDLPNFYMRRILRIWPAFYFLLFVDLCRIPFSENSDSIIASAAFASINVMNLNRAFGWGAEEIIGHTWSLSMEEQFYFFWPIVIAAISLNPMRKILPACVLAMVVWRVTLLFNGAAAERLYNGPDTHSDPLLVGCILALYGDRWRTLQLSGFVKLLPLVLFAAAIPFLSYDTRFALSVGYTVIAMAAAMLLVICLQDGPIRRIFSTRLFVFVGKNS